MKIKIIKKQIIYLTDQEVNTDKNIRNIECLGKLMSKCNKQHLNNIETQFIKKLSNTEAELNKCVPYKKAFILNAKNSF